jgi:hypothetical protein
LKGVWRTTNTKKYCRSPPACTSIHLEFLQDILKLVQHRDRYWWQDGAPCPRLCLPMVDTIPRAWFQGHQKMTPFLIKFF